MAQSSLQCPADRFNRITSPPYVRIASGVREAIAVAPPKSPEGPLGKVAPGTKRAAGSRTPSGRKPAREVSGANAVGHLTSSGPKLAGISCRWPVRAAPSSGHRVPGEDLEDCSSEVAGSDVAACRAWNVVAWANQERRQPRLTIAARPGLGGQVPRAARRMLGQLGDVTRPRRRRRAAMITRRHKNDLVAGLDEMGKAIRGIGKDRGRTVDVDRGHDPTLRQATERPIARPRSVRCSGASIAPGWYAWRRDRPATKPTTTSAAGFEPPGSPLSWSSRPPHRATPRFPGRATR